LCRREYRRAVADLMRDPGLCRGARAGVLGGDALSETERARVLAVARQQGMVVTSMLYRASRLVGISRRAPDLVEALGAGLGPAFDAYLAACPHAPPEFAEEARRFRAFVAGRGDQPA